MDSALALAIGADASDPLYIRTAKAIRGELLSGSIPPDQPIPPEHVLTKQFNVGRMTLRKAIDLLVDDHLLIRRRGIGTFVAAPRVTYPVVGLHSTREIAKAHNLDLKTEIIDYGEGPATERERWWLRLGAGAVVVRFVRRDSFGPQPISVAECTVPAAFADQFSAEALTRYSTYELMEQSGAARPTRAQQVLRAEAATAHHARLLSIPPASPIFVLERITFDSSETPLEHFTISYPSQCAECVVELHRGPGLRESASEVSLRFLALPSDAADDKALTPPVVAGPSTPDSC